MHSVVFDNLQHFHRSLDFCWNDNLIKSQKLTEATTWNWKYFFRAPKAAVAEAKYLSEEIKGEVYKALVLPTLLYGCEAWSLREDLFKRLRSFYNKCARSMHRVNLHHAFRHNTTSNSFFWAPPPEGGLDLVTNRQGAI